MTPGVDSASNGNEYQEYFLRSKGGRCVGLTNLPLSYVFKSGSIKLLGPSGPLTGLYSDCFTLNQYVKPYEFDEIGAKKK
jgi:hypothetical protein